MLTALDKFLTADWNGTILPRLTLYAAKLVHHFTWSTPGGLPKGIEVEDIVIGAIQKTLEGLQNQAAGKGIRNWNPEKCPDILSYLMGVVRSDVSALAKSHDHQKTNRENEDLSLEDLCLETGPTGSYAIDEGKERYQELVLELRNEIQGDKESEQVLLAIEEIVADEDEPTSTAIELLTGFSNLQVRNARRRLLTAVKALERKSKGGYTNGQKGKRKTSEATL